MTNENISLSSLGDQALWWDFRNRTIESNPIRISLDEWGRYEQRGDKITSFVFFRLTDKYNLPFEWANSLHEIFTSNEY